MKQEVASPSSAVRELLHKLINVLRENIKCSYHFLLRTGSSTWFSRMSESTFILNGIY